MFPKQRFGIGQCVLFTEQVPNAAFVIGVVTSIKLNLLQFSKLSN